MKFLDLVKIRKSVRKYTAKPIDRDIIDRCLQAAQAAPSACNSQPWYFIVVDTPELKKKIADAAFSGIHSINSFAKNAPVLVVVVRDKSKYLASLGGYFRGFQFNLIDIAIACEHFILQAAEEGVGSCWLGWFNEKAVKIILSIAHDKNIDIIISLGYPETEEQVVKKRKPLSEISKFNK